MTQRGRLAWLVGMVVTALVSQARAESENLETGRVLLFGLQTNFPTEAWPDVEQRIAAEIRVMGLVVVQADATVLGTSDRLDELIVLARDLGAMAGVVVGRDQGDVEIQLWLNDDGADLLVRRRIISTELQGPDTVSQVALSTVELLYGSLLEIDLITRFGAGRPIGVDGAVANSLDEISNNDDVATSSPNPEPPSQATQQPPSPQEPAVEPDDPHEARREEESPPNSLTSSPRRHRDLYRFRARSRLDVSVPFDPPSAMVSIDIGGGIRPISWFVIDVDAQLTASPYIVEGMSGGSNHYHAAFRAALSFEPLPRGPVRLGFGFGGGLLVAWCRGNGYQLDYYGLLDETVVGLVAISLRLAFPVTSRLRILFSSNVSFTFPDIEVLHGGERVASIGLPLLDLGIGVEWGLGRRLPENR